MNNDKRDQLNYLSGWLGGHDLPDSFVFETQPVSFVKLKSKEKTLRVCFPNEEINKVIENEHVNSVDEYEVELKNGGKIYIQVYPTLKPNKERESTMKTFNTTLKQVKEQFDTIDQFLEENQYEKVVFDEDDFAGASFAFIKEDGQWTSFFDEENVRNLKTIAELFETDIRQEKFSQAFDQALFLHIGSCLLDADEQENIIDNGKDICDFIIKESITRKAIQSNFNIPLSIEPVTERIKRKCRSLAASVELFQWVIADDYRPKTAHEQPVDPKYFQYLDFLRDWGIKFKYLLKDVNDENIEDLLEEDNRVVVYGFIKSFECLWKSYTKVIIVNESKRLGVERENTTSTLESTKKPE